METDKPGFESPFRRILGAAALGLMLDAQPALGASHREAPLISLDAHDEITDYYMFRS